MLFMNKLKQRRRTLDENEASDLYNSTSASVKILLDPATIETIEFHPGLFPMFRGVQVNLAVLLQMRLCTPERMLRINALLIGINSTSSPDKIGKILNKCREQVRRAGLGNRFSSSHYAIYNQITALYEDWWQTAWHCPIRRRDVLDDIIRDMRRYVQPVTAPTSIDSRKGFRDDYNRRTKLHYGFSEEKRYIEDPRNALTVGPGMIMDFDDDPKMHLTVHSSTPARYEYGMPTCDNLLRRPAPTPTTKPPGIQDGHLFSPPPSSPIAKLQSNRTYTSQLHLIAGELESELEDEKSTSTIPTPPSQIIVEDVVTTTSTEEEESVDMCILPSHPHSPTSASCPNCNIPTPPPLPPPQKFSAYKRLTSMIMSGKKKKDNKVKELRGRFTTSPAEIIPSGATTALHSIKEDPVLKPGLRKLALQKKDNEMDHQIVFRRPSLP